MRNILAVTAIFLCGTLSCRKFIIEPGPHRTDSTVCINLMFPNTDTTDLGSTYELIISEPGGKILLDSIAPYNVQVVTTLKTAQPLLDVSTVVHFTFGSYAMIIYKSVRPEEWYVIPNNPILPPYPTGTPGTITYTNAPVVDPNSVYFSSLPTTVSSSSGPIISGNQLSINYYGYPGNNIAYLMLPTLGQFSYQPISSLNDTISLAQMDTTIKIFYNIPSQYSLSITYMSGYLDTTDFTKKLGLYSYWERLPQGDLQYPPQSKVPAQKYSLDVDAFSVNNEYVSYRTFGTTAPTGTVTPPFPTTPIYTLNSITSDSFSVSWAQRPTNYTANWGAGNVFVSITASPDSNRLQALALVTSLHSKLLQGQDLSALSLNNFAYETAAGFDYDGYYRHQTNPVQLIANPFASDLLYILFSPSE